MDIQQKLDALNDQLTTLRHKEERDEQIRVSRYKEFLADPHYAFVHDRVSFHVRKPDGTTLDIADLALYQSGFEKYSSMQRFLQMSSIVHSTKINQPVSHNDPEYLLKLALQGKGFTEVGFRKDRQPVDRDDLEMLRYISSVEFTLHNSTESVQKLNEINDLQKRVSLVEDTAKSLLRSNNNNYTAVKEIANKIIGEQTLKSLLFDNSSGSIEQINTSIENAAYLAIYTEKLENNEARKNMELGI